MDFSKTVFRRNESVVTRDLAGEKVIIPIRGKVGDLGSIYTLNAVANDIWNLLDGKRTVADVIKQLQQEYEVDLVVLAADVERVLGEMQQEGLITNASQAGEGI